MNIHKDVAEYIESQRAKLDRLAKFPESGIIKACYLAGNVGEEDHSVTSLVDSLEIDSRGIHGDRHRRVARTRGPREKFIYGRLPDGEKPVTLERRHLFAVSPHDISSCTEQMGVEITPELLGANVIIEANDGRPYFLSHLPRGAYVVIGEKDAVSCPKSPKAVLTVHGQQYGCVVTGTTISRRYGSKELLKRFIASTKENRGLVLTVEYPVALEDLEGIAGREIPPSRIERGDTVFFRFPKGTMI